MKQLLLILSLAITLAGCDHNQITLTNQGAERWEEIQIKAGGRVFEVKELKGGTVQTLLPGKISLR